MPSVAATGEKIRRLLRRQSTYKVRPLEANGTVSQNGHKPDVLAERAESEGDDSEEARGKWGSQFEFILACLGYSVGLGNVWRFPYLCAQNGGGAFLIPYWISLFLAGNPLFFLEVSLGQYSSLGPNLLFKHLSPIFQGIGWGMVMVSLLVSIYYNMIIAWVLFYFFASFRTELQWARCDNHWNTEHCASSRDSVRCTTDFGPGAIFYNRRCYNQSDADYSQVLTTLLPAINKTSPATEYYQNYVLEMSSSFDDTGSFSWKLVLCLLGAWLLIFVCLAKGVQSTGKVVYFTATFPYVVLFILLIRGATLEGALDGIKFYIIPDWNKLTELKVWTAAAVQMFYSLGPSFGGLHTMASYNNFKNNCFRDAMIVGCSYSLTSMFAGFAIFSIVGYMAKTTGQTVAQVASESGPGLAFVAYPEALTMMPGGPFWSILFFFMLITLGLDSEFAMVETCTTAVMDEFPSLRKWKVRIVFVTCFCLFLLGLPLCTRSGIYLFTVIDNYSASYCCLIFATLECFVVSYVYGIKRFVNDLTHMLGFRPCPWYFVSWMFAAPIFLMFIFVNNCMEYQGASYKDYQFPFGAMLGGWFVVGLTLIPIPMLAVYHIIRVCRKRHCDRGCIIELFAADEDWCPAHERKERKRLAGIGLNGHVATIQSIGNRINASETTKV